MENNLEEKKKGNGILIVIIVVLAIALSVTLYLLLGKKDVQEPTPVSEDPQKPNYVFDIGDGEHYYGGDAFDDEDFAKQQTGSNPKLTDAEKENIPFASKGVDYIELFSSEEVVINVSKPFSNARENFLTYVDFSKKTSASYIESDEDDGYIETIFSIDNEGIKVTEEGKTSIITNEIKNLVSIRALLNVEIGFELIVLDSNNDLYYVLLDSDYEKVETKKIISNVKEFDYFDANDTSLFHSEGQNNLLLVKKTDNILYVVDTYTKKATNLDYYTNDDAEAFVAYLDKPIYYSNKGNYKVNGKKLNAKLIFQNSAYVFVVNDDNTLYIMSFDRVYQISKKVKTYNINNKNISITLEDGTTQTMETKMRPDASIYEDGKVIEVKY